MIVLKKMYSQMIVSPTFEKSESRNQEVTEMLASCLTYQEFLKEFSTQESAISYHQHFSLFSVVLRKNDRNLEDTS